MIQTAEQYEFVHRALCLFEQTLVGKCPTQSGDWDARQAAEEFLRENGGILDRRTIAALHRSRVLRSACRDKLYSTIIVWDKQDVQRCRASLVSIADSISFYSDELEELVVINAATITCNCHTTNHSKIAILSSRKQKQRTIAG